MSLHVCVLGIDGSGKSSVAASLPMILAAELNVVAGSAGEKFYVMGPEEDYLAPKFHPDGFPLSARLAKKFKAWAKRVVDRRKLYPLVKLSHLISQDQAARRLARRYRADVMVSDGNTLLSATGRTANYRRPASDGAPSVAVQAPGVEDLAAVFAHLVEGRPLPEETVPRVPSMTKARRLAGFCRLFGVQAAWLPDAVLFLDLSPARALGRIGHRAGKVDRHENAADLAQTREMYLKTIEAFRRFRPSAGVYRIDADDRTPGEVLQKALVALEPQINSARAANPRPEIPLGTTATELAGPSVWRKILNARYLFGYLVAKFFQDAWREPLFPFSKSGRLLLKEGYSAGVMQVIYDHGAKPQGVFDRIFLGYPLHRAVYDRVGILARKIQGEMESRLERGGKISVFTAPSGVAYDLFRPLEAIAAENPEAARRVEITAADLDPHGVLAESLSARARLLGVKLEFIRGDLTSDEFRARFAADVEFDIALFVGLSSWLPRPATVRHLRWVREHLADDGVLVTDCFSADAYALSGRYVGYKAEYYTPESYSALLDYCGFDGLGAAVEGGRDRINHVVVARRRLPLASSASDKVAE